jgi:hypothetical protein
MGLLAKLVSPGLRGSSCREDSEDENWKQRKDLERHR